MNKTNLEKFEEIETMMDKVKELMEPYETALEGRYEYMNVLRKEYSDLSHTFGRIQQSLRRKQQDIEVDDDVKMVTKDALSRLEAHIEAIEEDSDVKDSKPLLKRLKRAKTDLEDKINADHIDEVWKVLREMKLEVEEVNVLMEYVEVIRNSNQDESESIISHIERIRSEYLGSFVMYREAIERGEDIQKEVDDVIADLEDAGFVKESDDLFDVRPDIAEERGKRPNPEPLLEVLNPIKSAGLEYFQSNNNKSESYDLNVKFAKEVAYTRRALLENREYKGTNSAFERLNTAFDNLSTYMNARYYQLGGKPKNFHGHEDRKR